MAKTPSGSCTPTLLQVTIHWAAALRPPSGSSGRARLRKRVATRTLGRLCLRRHLEETLVWSLRSLNTEQILDRASGTEDRAGRSSREAAVRCCGRPKQDVSSVLFQICQDCLVNPFSGRHSLPFAIN